MNGSCHCTHLHAASCPIYPSELLKANKIRDPRIQQGEDKIAGHMLLELLACFGYASLIVEMFRAHWFDWGKALVCAASNGHLEAVNGILLFCFGFVVASMTQGRNSCGLPISLG